MICRNCQKFIEEAKNPLPFRFTCPFCDTYQHACAACRYYRPGLPNDCEVLNTDPIRDRESFNYCEEFDLKKEGKAPTADSSEIERSLFKEGSSPKKRSFDDLF